MQWALHQAVLCSLFATVALLIPACDEPDEVFERIDKLRAIGVATTPVVAQPSTAAAPQTMTLTFHVAVPLGQEVVATPFLDEDSPFAPSVPIELIPGSETYVEHAAFRLYSVKALAPVPGAESLPVLPGTAFARLRYGLSLTSGGEEEKIVGTYLVYLEGSPELAWNTTPPYVDITAPAASARLSGKQSLIATISNPIGEKMRVGWFVSKGTLKNRRAKETEWDPDGSGPQTVIFTARGLSSGAFALEVVDVTVQ